MKPIILVILDGWGIGRQDNSNPIYIADPKNIGYIKRNFLAGGLQASGIAVGLPWGEEGNSEIGHLTIGAGRVVFQHYPRISTAIRNGEFFKNKVLLDAVSHAKKNNSAVNLIGLLCEGNVHASLEHLIALIKLAKEQGAPKINLHLFSDGKDSAPRSFLRLLSKIDMQPATVSGRRYAMDRTKHWDYTAKTYNVLVGRGQIIENLNTYITHHYEAGLDDEVIEPAIIGSAGVEGVIKNNDTVIFFNFREDSMRQIVESFINPDFQQFPIKKLNNLYVVTMTRYSEKFNIPVAFPPETINKPLGKVLAEHHKTQLRIAETEKYAHVTYFFNGLQDATFDGEFRVLIPSRADKQYQEHPEMMAPEITNRAAQAIEEKSFDFILINYANPDTLAHAGNYEAAMKAIEIVDGEIGKLLKIILANDAAMIITSDHGNVENMLNLITLMPETKHDPNPVPIYLIGKKFQTMPKDDKKIGQIETNTIGILSDVAPTILDLMNIPKPPEMTGRSLLKDLR